MDLGKQLEDLAERREDHLRLRRRSQKGRKTQTVVRPSATGRMRVTGFAGTVQCA